MQCCKKLDDDCVQSELLALYVLMTPDQPNGFDTVEA